MIAVLIAGVIVFLIFVGVIIATIVMATKTHRFDPLVAQIGEDLQVRDEGFLGRMFDQIKKAFSAPVSSAPAEVAAFKIGDCVDLATLSGNPRFGLASFDDGQFYDTDYCVSEGNCRRGRFRFRRDDSRICWEFIGDLDKSCGKWTYDPANETEACPFSEDDCDELREHFGDNHEGTNVMDSGLSYEYKAGVITCHGLA